MTQIAILHTTTPLSSDEARALTNRIRESVESLWVLLLEAYERNAWKALGYGSWKEYVEAEFGMHRSRSYQLLDQGRVIRALRDASRVSTVVDVSEREARDIKPVLPEVTEAVRTRVEQGEEPAEAVRAVIEIKREERKAPVVDPEPQPMGTGDEDEVEDPEYGAAPEMDLHAELEHALEENQRLASLIESMSEGSDVAAQLRKESERCARLEGRLRQEMRTAAEHAKDAKRRARLLKDVRALLGVEGDREILPRLREVLR